MSWLVDPDAVAGEYASEQALGGRVLAPWELVEGPDDEAISRAHRIATREKTLSLRVGRG